MVKLLRWGGSNTCKADAPSSTKPLDDAHQAPTKHHEIKMAFLSRIESHRRVKLSYTMRAENLIAKESIW